MKHNIFGVEMTENQLNVSIALWNKFHEKKNYEKQSTNTIATGSSL